MSSGGSPSCKVSRNGVSTQVAELKRGNFFGEVALLKDEPRNATVRAFTVVETFSLTKDRFLAALRNHKSFEEQMASTLFVR